MLGRMSNQDPNKVVLVRSHTNLGAKSRVRNPKSILQHRVLCKFALMVPYMIILVENLLEYLELPTEYE